MSLSKKCAIKYCQSESNKLFSAPQDSQELYKWKQLVGTTRNSFFICENHFEEGCVQYEKVLKEAALPSLLLSERDMTQESFCECCFRSIYRNESSHCINNHHREIFKSIFQNFELNPGIICARCNEKLLSFARFKSEIEEQQRIYRSYDAERFEPKVKLEVDHDNDECAVYEEQLEPAISHFIPVKTEYEQEEEALEYDEDGLEEPDNDDDDTSPTFNVAPKRKRNRKQQRQAIKGTRRSATLYHCDFCQNFSADNKKEYAEHIMLYHALNPTPEEKEAKAKCTPVILDSIELDDFSMPAFCDICGKKAKHKKALINHMKLYHVMPVNEVDCTKCSKSFKDMNQLTRHRNRFHSDGTRFWCTCGKLFKNQQDQRKCRASHKKSSSNRSECDECDKVFTNERQLLNHKNKIHGNGKRFWCVRCGSMYPTKEAQTICVKRHYNDSLKDVMVKCPICSKELLHNSLKIHMKSTHSTVRDAVCHQCGKSFVAVSRLTIHVRQVHNNGLKPYQCAHCPLRTALKKAMKEHLFKRHATQRRTYKCSICLKVTQEVLDRHMALVHPNGYDNGVRVNPETNMYHCPNCVQQFTQMKRYEQHVNENICANYGDYEFQAAENGKFSVFTKGKFKCKICDSVQSSLSRLRRHMNYIHSGEQNCPVCDKKMRSKRSVISHLRKVHKTSFTAVMNASNS